MLTTRLYVLPDSSFSVLDIYVVTVVQSLRLNSINFSIWLIWFHACFIIEINAFVSLMKSNYLSRMALNAWDVLHRVIAFFTRTVYPASIAEAFEFNEMNDWQQQSDEYHCNILENAHFLSKSISNNEQLTHVICPRWMWSAKNRCIWDIDISPRAHFNSNFCC